MVPWTCVFNVLDYGSGASNPDASFAKAQEAALSAGGGVVYFPQGEYTFTELIRIQSGIVIRGDATTKPAKSGKKPGSLAPATTFACPDRQHLGIFNNDANATGLGVVNIALVGCSVMLWPALTPAQPVAFPGFLKTYWYGATGVAGSGSHKLVLSSTSTQVAYGRVDPTNASSNPYSYRFGVSISVYGEANVLVANNLVTPSPPQGPNVTLTLSGKQFSTAFPYDNRYGVDVNRLLFGGVIGHACAGGPGNADPSCAPWFFPANVTVRDNWVFNCGRVSYSVASGCNGGNDAPVLGAGLQLVNNHAEHCAGATCYTVDGSRVAGGSDTNENRGLDVAGWCLNATGNSGHIYRMHTPGGFVTVDGEGLLMQAASNSPARAHLWAGNDMSYGSRDALASGYLAFYKLSSVQDVSLVDNTADASQYIGAVCDAAHDKLEGVTCKGNSPPATLCGKPCSG